jgi:hypothetical protein
VEVVSPKIDDLPLVYEDIWNYHPLLIDPDWDPNCFEIGTFILGLICLDAPNLLLSAPFPFMDDLPLVGHVYGNMAIFGED